MPISSHSKVRHQSGAALMVVLLILLIMALLSTSLVSSTVVASRLVANQQHQMEVDIVARSAQAQVMNQLWNVLNESDANYSFSLPTGFFIVDDFPATECLGQVSGQTNVLWEGVNYNGVNADFAPWDAVWYYHYWESVLTVKHRNSGARVTATAGFKYLSDSSDDDNCKDYGPEGIYNLGLNPNNWPSIVDNQDGESWQDDPSLKPEKPGDGGLIIHDGRVRMTYFYLHID